VTCARSCSLALCLAALDSPACDDADAEPFIGDEDYVRDPALDVALVSARGGAISHDVGQNCMQCHQAARPRAGPLHRRRHAARRRRRAAGRRGDRAARRRGNGELVLRVEADGLGNFYTTEPLPLPDTPLFPTVYSGGRRAQPSCRSRPARRPATCATSAARSSAPGGLRICALAGSR
jgi:hypothetical protein